ncbi:MAG: sugar isomerase [Clostridia bacterium]|nr:sugar isomerase [Clostridia bacterium]
MAKMHKSKLNVLTTLMKQIVATLCGILLPRVLIGAFGSVVYGATTSIAQFLSYISLLEGGIGRVARGALYGPLANGDKTQVSRIHQAIRRFFLKIAGLFLIYTLVIAVFYHDIAEVTVFERPFTFGLVIAISLSTMANYLGGIADLTLMNADQKQYLTNAVMMITNVLNMLLVVVLVWMDANILVVKLASALVFVTRRVFYTGYVRKHYRLPKVSADGCQLEQKWTGMGQHIAYFLHTNTDIILLTLFADLKLVAVYAVYHLVIRSIWDISSSFAGGMEAAFGELIAKQQTEALNRSYRKYGTMLTLVAMVLFGCTGVLIIPFIRLYMAGVTDANYIQPVFALLLLLSEAINCLVLPYTTLPISANQLKQTRWGSYGEAILNVGLSLILIQWNPLIGVALGTLMATLFKALFYMNYTVKHILKCRLLPVLGRFLGAAGVLMAVSGGGMTLLWNVPMDNFFVWVLWAVVVFAAVAAVVLLFALVTHPKELKAMLKSPLSGRTR